VPRSAPSSSAPWTLSVIHLGPGSRFCKWLKTPSIYAKSTFTDMVFAQRVEDCRCTPVFNWIQLDYRSRCMHASHAGRSGSVLGSWEETFTCLETMSIYTKLWA
jgi:hypothetical protein